MRRLLLRLNTGGGDAGRQLTRSHLRSHDVEKKTYFDYFGGETTGSPDGQGEVGNSAPPAEAPAQDLRVSQRIPIGMSVKVQTLDGAEEFATTRNVSNRRRLFCEYQTLQGGRRSEGGTVCGP